MANESYTFVRAVPVSVCETAIFLDFDGTLAPIQDDPATVALPKSGDATLLSLNRLLNEALVLISGRDVRDLSSRTPTALWRAGGHGLETCQPGVNPDEDQAAIAPEVLQQVADITGEFDAVWVEEKGPVLAIHYRQNPSIGTRLYSEIQSLAEQIPDYKSQHGKMVIELKPQHANKGVALETLMQLPTFAGRTPIMVGDDTTDEDAMRAAKALGGFGIKVGPGPSLADFRFENTDTVWDWLRSIVNEHA